MRRVAAVNRSKRAQYHACQQRHRGEPYEHDQHQVRAGEPRLVGSIVALISIPASVLGVTVYLLLFLENGLGLAATAAGGVLIAAGLWTPTLSRRTARIADRIGARQPVSVGLFTAASRTASAPG
jgi:hypothetical protein